MASDGSVQVRVDRHPRLSCCLDGRSFGMAVHHIGDFGSLALVQEVEESQSSLAATHDADALDLGSAFCFAHLGILE